MDYRDRFYKSYVTDHLKFAYDDAVKGFEILRKMYTRWYLPVLPADKNTPILDVACGQGQFLYFLGKAGYANCNGIDVSEEQLEIARKIGIQNIAREDVFSFLPKHKEEYGVVVANHIIEHLRKEEAVRLVDAIYGALKPGGLFIVGTPNASYLFAARNIYIDFTHETGYTAASLSQLMRVCGFESVEVYGEKPVPSGFKSTIRAGLWLLVAYLTKMYFAVAYGVGEMKNVIAEPNIFAVGYKKDAK